MALFYREKGRENSEKLIILHGLMGMSDNWLQYARHFSTHFHVLLPDMPNHGYSPDDEQFTYDSMLQTLLAWMDELAVEKAHIIGHSMGGKLAMLLALRYPERVEKLAVLDIAMRTYEAKPKQEGILDAILALHPEDISSRKELQERVKELVAEERLQMMLLKNIRTDGDMFQWKLNPGLIKKNMLHIYACIDAVGKFEDKTLLVYGLDSDYVSSDDIETMKVAFPKLLAVGLKGAGHWLHVDQAEALRKTLDHFFL